MGFEKEFHPIGIFPSLFNFTQGWRQKVIRLSFEEYAERLGFLCQHSKESIDVVARSEVSKFWEYDWQDTLERHKGKPVRRIFVFRNFSEIADNYIDIFGLTQQKSKIRHRNF